MRRARAPGPASPERRRLRAGALLALALAFTGASLLVYEPAFEGGFVSDDHGYIDANPYVKRLDASSVAALWDPTSPAGLMVSNYAPLHLLAHALEWRLFGTDPTGYHVVNALLHALAALLLVLLLAEAGVGPAGAAAAGALFLVHPANVEAVAWMSQLKSPLGLALAAGALLAWPRRPALATAGFALALLAKPQAAFALPVAALFDLARRRRVRVGWLAAWAVVLCLYAAAELAAQGRTGVVERAGADPAAVVRTAFALGAHYAWMAATSLGVSPFHEVAPARSWLDSRWLAGLGLAALAAARALPALARRREEAAWWAWAAAGFVPVAQVFAFSYPLADRYLYFILPGLLGVLALGAREARAPLAAAWSRRVGGSAEEAARALGRGALVATLALAALFAWRAHEQAAVWRSAARVTAEAARHYPEGRVAQLQRARRAAQAGDADAAIEALRAAHDAGYRRFRPLLADPRFEPLRDDPRFRALVAEIAGRWVEWGRALEEPTPLELRTVALAHRARGEYAQAERLLERALGAEGPLAGTIRAELEELRRERRRAEGGGS